MNREEIKNKLQALRTFLNEQKGRVKERQDQIAAAQQRAVYWQKEYLEAERARTIIQLVAKKTQDQFSYRIKEPVDLAMAAIFDDPLELEIEYPLRRGNTECDFLWVDKDGNVYPNLEYCDGGGAMDPAEFSMQLAILSIGVQQGVARPIMIKDEPLKWLKGGDLPKRGALMMSELSHELDIQMIAVSHIPEQKAGADRLIRVEKSSDRVSKVTWEDQ